MSFFKIIFFAPFRDYLCFFLEIIFFDENQSSQCPRRAQKGGEGANGLKKTLNILAMVLIYWAIVDSVLTT